MNIYDTECEFLARIIVKMLVSLFGKCKRVLKWSYGAVSSSRSNGAVSFSRSYGAVSFITRVMVM